MLETRLPCALRDVGFDESQIQHAMRNGGPLDDIRHRTWCETCSRSTEGTLREMLANQGKCKCGGSFHVREGSRDLIEEIVGSLTPKRGV